MKKVKVLSLFSGIGAFEKALSNIGVNYELIAYSEICPHASQAYSVVHNVSEKLNLGDITKINEKELPDFDLMTWGFPCTNFSRATRNKLENRNGLDNDASGLYFEGLRILKEKKPAISIIENVSDLVTEKFKEQFSIIQNDLKDCGYVTHYKVLNSKDYNLPQSRQRLIIVSIREDIYKGFEFPTKIGTNIVASDLLLDISEVDDKFKKVNPKIVDKIKSRGLRDINLCPTITKAIGRAGSSSEYISNCALVYHNTGHIRRMTPLETLLFQGFTKEDYIKMKSVTSDTQIYNFSGNTIPVTMLEYLFTKLFIDFKYADELKTTTIEQVNNETTEIEPIKIVIDEKNQLCFSF